MNKYETIYEPAEDSFFMEKTLKSYLNNKSNLTITEVGVGSGFVFSEIVSSFPNHKYSATDINPDAIKSTKQRLEKKKLQATLYQGIFLEPLKEKQDLIFFNTPYLPCENGEKYDSLTLKDKAIYGGKHGYEIIFSFIDQIYNKLKLDGSVFMLFSSLSKEYKIRDKLIQEGFFINNVYREKHFMEELIIYEFSKSVILKKIEKFGVENISYFTKGKRSMIYGGTYNGESVICKTSGTHFTEKENIFLQKLQSYSFVPKLFYFDSSIQVMGKCKGDTIRNFLDTSSKEDTLKVLQSCLDICYELDTLGFQKFELTNPYKHIFVDNNLDVKFIDFERTIHSQSPKNVGQFLQYIRRNIRILKERDILILEERILSVAEKYKQDSIRIDFSVLLD
jgi:HemK-related putative methylase